MKDTFFGKLLSSGIQVVATQVLGGVFFLVTAAYLSKDELGYFGWANSVALAMTMVLSFGLDQVVVRRIAATNSDWAASAYLFHAFLGSVITLGCIVGVLYIPGISKYLSVVYLPLFFVSQGLIFIGNPLRQLLTAKEIYRPWAVVSVISNVAKLAIAILLISYERINITSVAYTLIGCAAFELVALLLYLTSKQGFSFYFKRVAYFKLMKEARPQFIAVIFDAILARADVILVGLMTAPAVTAEYSFAYRIYEIAKLPLTVAGPILLARFAPMLNFNNNLEDDKKTLIQKLLAMELFLATLIPLVLVILWSPVLNIFFTGKFGSTNETQFLILSLSIPVHFYINMLWTLGFAAKKYKEISQIIAVTAILNVLLNLALIPIWGAEGAAFAYLATSVLQIIGYHRMVGRYIMSFPLRDFFVFLLLGAGSYLVAIFSTPVATGQVAIAITLYVVIAVLTKRVNKEHIGIIRTFFIKRSE